MDELVWIVYMANSVCNTAVFPMLKIVLKKTMFSVVVWLLLASLSPSTTQVFFVFSKLASVYTSTSDKRATVYIMALEKSLLSSPSIKDKQMCPKHVRKEEKEKKNLSNTRSKCCCILCCCYVYVHFGKLLIVLVLLLHAFYFSWLRIEILWEIFYLH